MMPVLAGVLGGGVAVDYTLRVDPLLAANAALAGATIYDSGADWISVGRVYVVDTSTGTVSIENGRIKFAGTNSWLSTGICGADLHTWGTPGRITKFKHTTTTSWSNTATVFGHRNATNGVDIAYLYGFAPHSIGEAISLYENGSNVATPAGSLGITYTFALVEKPIGYDFYLKGGTQYPEWTKVRAGSAGTVNYAAMFATYRGTGYLDYLAVTSSAHTEITAALLDSI